MNISQSECTFQSTNMDAQKYQKSVLGKSCKPCSSRLKELKRQSVKVMMVEYNKMMLGNGVPCVSTLRTNHLGVFYIKGVLWNFVKFRDILKFWDPSTGLFLWILQIFTEHLQATASVRYRNSSLGFFWKVNYGWILIEILGKHTYWSLFGQSF